MLTRCTDIEGLFVPEDPPPRGRFVLLGCTAADRIRDVLTAADRAWFTAAT